MKQKSPETNRGFFKPEKKYKQRIYSLIEDFKDYKCNQIIITEAKRKIRYRFTFLSQSLGNITDIMDEGLKQRISKLLDFQENKMDSYFKYLRGVNIISTGLLSLLVGLKPDEIQEGSAQYLFLATITLLGLGILFSAITQFHEVTYWKQKMKAQNKMIEEYNLSNGAKQFQSESLPKPTVYKISEVLTFFCLGLSIVTLIAYVFALELNL